MHCMNCGQELVPEAKFCGNCGAPVPGRAPVPGIIRTHSKSSGLAIASMVLGISGIVTYGLTGIIGLIMGIIALRKINRSQGELEGKGFAIAGIATGAATFFLMFIVIGGIMAAIAIPNFLRFQARAKQSEARTNLGAIYIMQADYFNRYGRYAKTFKELGWTPNGSIRYAYFLSQKDSFQPSAKEFTLPEDVEAFVNDNDFKMVAVGNIDPDATLDIWSIDQDKNIVNIVNDVTN